MTLPAPQKERGGGGEGEVEAVFGLGSRSGTRHPGPTSGRGHGGSGLLASRRTLLQRSATGGRRHGLSVLQQLHTCTY